MPRYAIAMIDYLDNRPDGDGLQLKIIRAVDWKAALESTFPSRKGLLDSDDIEEAQDEACDQDWEFAVYRIANY